MCDSLASYSPSYTHLGLQEMYALHSDPKKSPSSPQCAKRQLIETPQCQTIQTCSFFILF